MIQCEHYQRGDCRSCQWLELPYSVQLEQKTVHLQQQLHGLDTSHLSWIAPFQSSLDGFRNKAKMVVSGAVERPILGILLDPREPQSAVDLASNFIRGMHQAGMAATGKHFPGHGHVIADSHLETPYDERSQEDIFNQDIQPFQQLIEQNLLQAIMPAHVIYSQCDSQPASGSKYWLQDILRAQLNFNGAIFSDDLGMKGAGFMGDFVARSEQALNSGCDLLLLCNERDGVVQVLDNLKLSEKQSCFLLRQQRLQTLFKRKKLTWSELECAPRWLENRQKLTALQQQWLATKN